MVYRFLIKIVLTIFFSLNTFAVVLYDKNELINLANDPKYLIILDSLKKAIDLRIENARLKPSGLGRQFEQRTYNRIKYTPGDIYDANGKRIYFKPSNE